MTPLLPHAFRICLLGGLLILAIAQPIAAQEKETAQPVSETSMEPILRQADEMRGNLEKQGYEIVRLEVDILKTAKDAYRLLFPDYQYGVLAFGDYRFEGIDLRVYQDVDGEWKELEEVEKEVDDAYVLITFKPKTAGKYRFGIEATKFADDYTGGHYGLIIFH